LEVVTCRWYSIGSLRSNIAAVICWKIGATIDVFTCARQRRERPVPDKLWRLGALHWSPASKNALLGCCTTAHLGKVGINGLEEHGELSRFKQDCPESFLLPVAGQRHAAFLTEIL